MDFIWLYISEESIFLMNPHKQTSRMNVKETFCHMMAPTFNRTLHKWDYIIFFSFFFPSLHSLYWLIPCVQSRLVLFLPARLLRDDSFHLWPWKASAPNHQGYEPLLTLSLSLPLSLFTSFSLTHTHTHTCTHTHTHTHTHHLRSRLPNELKKPSCVLHAVKKLRTCRYIPSDKSWQRLSQ